MEKEIKIPVSGRKCIYGILRGSLKNPLIIFVHGLTGHMNEHLFYNASRYFERKEFSCFRFNLYGFEKDARKMAECDLSVHGRDLDSVIEYFKKKKVKRIFVVGHSYGGPAVLFSEKKDYDGIVLWEPSYGLKGCFGRERYVTQLDAYLNDEDWPYGVIFSKKFLADRNVSNERIRKLIHDIRVPVEIICAGKGILIKGGRKYYAAANKPKKFTIIKKASHCFDEDGTEEKLFKETHFWLKKYKW